MFSKIFHILSSLIFGFLALFWLAALGASRVFGGRGSTPTGEVIFYTLFIIASATACLTNLLCTTSASPVLRQRNLLITLVALGFVVTYAVLFSVHHSS